MKVRMIESRFGAGGALYAAGTTQDLPDELALRFVGDRAAEIVVDRVRPDFGGEELPAADVAALRAQYFCKPVEESILAAFARAVAAGGGEIIIPAGRIPLTQSLPLAPGVRYRGAGYRFKFANWPDHGDTTLDDTYGTVFVGDGTFDGVRERADGLTLAEGTALYGTPGNAAARAAYANTGLTGVGIVGCAFKNFRNGIIVGAQNRLGLTFGQLDVAVTECTRWGVWLENFAHMRGSIHSIGNRVGQVAFVSSGGAWLQPGNSHFEKVLASVPTDASNQKIRGILWAAYNGTGLNFVSVGHIQCNRFAATSVVQSATMNSGNANIGVTDLSKFDVGMPVTFSASSNGFVAGRVYFVLSKSADSGAGTLQVALRPPLLSAWARPDGWRNDSEAVNVPPAWTPSGSSAISIQTNGFSNWELMGYDNALVIAPSTGAVDMEGGATARVLMSRVRVADIRAQHIPDDGSALVEWCLRDAYGDIHLSGWAQRFDADTSSFYRVFGQRGSAATGQSLPGGFHGIPQSGLGNNSTATALSMKMQALSGKRPTLTYNYLGSDALEVNSALQIVQAAMPAAGATLDLAAGPVHVYQGAGGTATLPTITSSNVGSVVLFMNKGGSAVTLSTSSSQTFNGVGTSKTVVANGAISLLAAPLVASPGSAADYAWLVIGSA